MCLHCAGQSIHTLIQCVPLATEPGISLIILPDRCSVSQQLGALQKLTTDTFLFISHTTNVLLLKFLCNIFIGVRIIKDMPGSVGSGAHYICSGYCILHFRIRLQWKWNMRSFGILRSAELYFLLTCRDNLFVPSSTVKQFKICYKCLQHCTFT